MLAAARPVPSGDAVDQADALLALAQPPPLAADASAVRQLLQKTQPPKRPKAVKGADTASKAFGRLRPKML